MKRLATLSAGCAALLTAAAAADPLYDRPPAADGFSYPECYCTNRGERVAIGEYSCLRIGSREYTARCGMSLNNPAWRDRTEGCDPSSPVSEAPPSSKPASQLVQQG